MTLPETTFVRRKDILAYLGISRHKFYVMVELGHIRQTFMHDKRGRECGKPLYHRDDVIKAQAFIGDNT